MNFVIHRASSRGHANHGWLDYRGVVLECEERGSRSRFMCPFHAWTYSNTGKLVSVPKPDHFGKIDKDCHGLVPLPAVERYGFLWVHPRPDAEYGTRQ